MPDTRSVAPGLVAAVIVLAAVLGVVAWQWAGGHESDGSQPRAVLVFYGDQCHLVPTACNGPTPASTFVIDDTAPLAPASAGLVAQPLDDSDAAPPDAAVVAVPAPPPRPA